MAGTERVVIPYAPRRAFLPFHQRKQRWAVMVAHRRAGKTVACINDLIRAALSDGKPDGRYAYIAPQFNQAKDVAWMYLRRFCGVIPGAEFNESELRVELPNGSRIRLYGADNPDRLRGIYLDGVVLDEYADMRPSVWGEIVRPLLTDRQGWAVFIGTPKGRNAFWSIWDQAASNDRWFRLMLRASEAGILPADELSDAQGDMTPEQYAQEFECSFEAAILGAYYAKELRDAENDGRICPVPVERSALVHVAWDLGVGDSTALVFCQVIGREWRIVDYYEANGVGLDHYVQVLNGKGYTYGDQILPHDVGVRELGTGRSRLEVLDSLGVRNVKVLPATSVDDGINAVRMTLSKCWFDATRCHDLLEALRQYRTEYDDRLKRFKPRPLHDWTSHAADAFRYLCVGLDEYTPPKRQNVEIGGSYAWMG
jgi:hypothetical protein